MYVEERHENWLLPVGRVCPGLSTCCLPTNFPEVLTMSRGASFCTLATVAILMAVFLYGCSSSTSSSSVSPATVNVMVSDPATCSAPQGAFSHIYVTITDVKINASATAGDNDAGWIDLTPSLQQNPQQVDLLGQANNQCFLAMLGSTSELQPGSYQQIRIFLASNSATVNSNQCGSTANCVMLTSSAHTPQPLLLSSELQPGIKVPSEQIAGGQLTVAAGRTEDKPITLPTCANTDSPSTRPHSLHLTPH